MLPAIESAPGCAKTPFLMDALIAMPTHFDLIITADVPNHTAEFRLLDAHGSQLAYRQTDFKTISVSHRHGLFNLRDYLRLYVEEGKEAAAVAEIGVCIAEDVLGEDIFKILWESKSQRTLRVQLPGASEQENHLAAALARVPWEIAKPQVDADTLGERNLLVRIVHDMHASASQPIELASGEALRVLFVFAQARGSRPLGARKERRDLLRLFEREIYPQRRVIAHFLTHGVTRERLIDQIQHNNGYHVVHWSGHGNRNLLDLLRPNEPEKKNLISGQELLDLFTKAGGFLPRLVFLSACHSGDILRVKDWKDFLAVAQGKESGAKEADTKDLDLQKQPGFTGTAHALLHGGVPSVVAMRYTVGDDYARELAVEFYRALLAHTQPKNATAALTLARQALLDGKKHDLARFVAWDHVTPVLYGAEQPGLTLLQGRSPELNPRDPRLHRIAELTTASHEHFVGRTWELAGLGAEFIGSSSGVEVKPVAVIIGLGGMGKTALVAEALDLWKRRFEWVLLYQAKPNALGFDATLRDIDLKLRGELGRYYDHIKARPADAIYRDASADFTGPARFERLTGNLIRALQDEAILLVLDNFESNLKPQAEPTQVAGQPVWACQDPAWDRCLAALATELVGTRSRVLITSRKPLAALADDASYPVLLGPLPASEAALYLRGHPALSRLAFSANAGEKALALRLLNASRFHPLLMDRLARLAADAKLRPQLLQALDTLEKTKDFAQLPALFATTPGDAKELDYLNDALTVSLDQLIRDASPDARQVLWMIAVANEPVRLGLLNSVWNGAPAPCSESQPLLRYLVSVGLVTEEREDADDANPELTCHELVRERICAWMEQHPGDRGEWTENAIRLAYADRLKAFFHALQHRNMTAALEAGSRALVYCVQAGDWDRLGGFASSVITGTSDPRLLVGLIPHLQTAAESAPEGQLRWCCLCFLADALWRGGRHKVSQPFYEQAATLARAAAEAGGENSQRAWADLAVITGNWAGALVMTGNLDAARQRRLESAEVEKKMGRPQISVISSELEVLRIDIMQGQVETALPELEARLAQVATWWQRHRSGQSVPEALDAEVLARAYISALDIAKDADFARQDWEFALRRLDAVLEVKCALARPAEDIAGDRMNRANVLTNLGRFGEARAELEACHLLSQTDSAISSKVLGSLAMLFGKQGDVAQAIIQERRSLALCEQLPDPSDRASSHNNLAAYLEYHAKLPALAEASRHHLAALIYRLVAKLGQHLQGSLCNYTIGFRRAHAAGIELVVPRVAELLADSAFHPLEQWLWQSQVDVAELQAEVDQLLEWVQRAALEQDEINRGV